MTPKLIIFDLDNTLIATRPAAKVGYKQAIYYLAKRSGLYASRDKLYNHWKRLVQTLNRETDPNKRRFSYSLRLLLTHHKLPDTYLPDALKTYEREMLSHLSLVPGAKELLKSLKDTGHIVAVATGSDRAEAIKKLKKVVLYRNIDFLVTANEVGVMKPNQAYYQLCLKEFPGKKSSVLVVGDDQKEDLDPAIKLGLKTYLNSPNLKHLNLISETLTDWLKS
jgi:HAD superfamily hydrolase (TIGR01549 family)